MITVIGSETEQMTNSFVFNEEKNPQAGNYSYPITFINSFLGHPIIFNGRRTLVSVGNGYSTETFQGERSDCVFIRWATDFVTTDISGDVAAARKNSANQNLFDKATVVYMTGTTRRWKCAGNSDDFRNGCSI